MKYDKKTVSTAQCCEMLPWLCPSLMMLSCMSVALSSRLADTRAFAVVAVVDKCECGAGGDQCGHSRCTTKRAPRGSSRSSNKIRIRCTPQIARRSANSGFELQLQASSSSSPTVLLRDSLCLSTKALVRED